MKKLILSAMLSVFMMASFAQSEKFESAMKDRIAALDTTQDMAALKDLSAAFERIADAEKTQWLPYYYAALSNVMSGLMTGANQAAKTDPLADKAEALLLKAEELQPSPFTA